VASPSIPSACRSPSATKLKSQPDRRHRRLDPASFLFRRLSVRPAHAPGC
jgi:hypothetical protein